MPACWLVLPLLRTVRCIAGGCLTPIESGAFEPLPAAHLLRRTGKHAHVQALEAALAVFFTSCQTADDSEAAEAAEAVAGALDSALLLLQTPRLAAAAPSRQDLACLR